MFWYCSLSFLPLYSSWGILIRSKSCNFPYSTSRVWFCFNGNQCKWRQTTGLRLKSNWHIYRMFVFAFVFFVVGSQYSCSFTKVGVALVRVSIHTTSQNFYWSQILPHVRQYAFGNPGSFYLINLEYSSRNPESQFHWQGSGIQTVLDSLIWGEKFLVLRVCC